MKFNTSADKNIPITTLERCKKAILSGNTLEVSVSYQAITRVNGVKCNWGKPHQRVKKEDRTTTDSDKLKNMAKNFRRKRTKARRLALCNAQWQFAFRPKFLTLTNRDIPTFEESARRLDVFIKAFRRLYPKLKYICSMELQERGSVHYHLILFNAPYVGKDWLSKNWGNVQRGHGKTQIEQIRSMAGLVWYISTYISSLNDDNLPDLRLYGQRTLSYSRNLLLPIALAPKYINTKTRGKLMYISNEHDYKIYFYSDKDYHNYQFDVIRDINGKDFLQIPIDI